MDKSTKKKAAASAVAAVTAAGVLVGGAFSSPADIMDDGPDALVQAVDMDSQYDSGDSGGDGEEEERGIYASVRRLVRQSPAPVRAAVAVPLWLLGSFVLWLAAGLWAAILSPVFSALLGWLALGLMALIIFVLAVKTAAPDLPIKKILNKGSVLGILLLSMAFGLLDTVLPLFWEAYENFARYARLFASGLCTFVPIAFFLRRHRLKLRRQHQLQLERREELERLEQERRARKLIEELADSVSS